MIFFGLPLTLPGIEVLEGKELGPSDVLGCLSVAIQSADAASQDTLNGAAVELFEDLRGPYQIFSAP